MAIREQVPVVPSLPVALAVNDLRDVDAALSLDGATACAIILIVRGKRGTATRVVIVGGVGFHVRALQVLRPLRYVLEILSRRPDRAYFVTFQGTAGAPHVGEQMHTWWTIRGDIAPAKGLDEGINLRRVTTATPSLGQLATHLAICHLLASFMPCSIAGRVFIGDLVVVQERPDFKVRGVSAPMGILGVSV